MKIRIPKNPTSNLSLGFLEVLKKIRLKKKSYQLLVIRTWRCQTSLVSCTVLTCSRQNLQNRNKENLVESTSVVPVKYPLKVKLENFYNFRVPELG